MTKAQRKIAVIGSGFAGLAAATCLADEGHNVTILEKNSTAGGRAREFAEKGFRFDMGPSWYWMPDVFEKYFARFGKKPSDYYELKRLDPSYRIFFPGEEQMDVPAGMENIEKMFEEMEPGSTSGLQKFIADGKYKYDVGINDLVYKPGLSVTEFFDLRVLTGVFKLDMFSSVASLIKKYFKDPKLVQLLEFPALFLGAPASRTPALYTLMNYADLALGTWYPMGGMYKIVDALIRLALSKGVTIEYNAEVTAMKVGKGKVASVSVNGDDRGFDYVVAAADYHHIEQHLLPEDYRQYTQAYWNNRVLAPSCLIFYLGVDTTLSNLLHHNLFFDASFDLHAKEIYDAPEWPSDPLFYVCCTSKTDPSTAPPGCENIFILMPVAPGLKDDEQTRELFFTIILKRIEDRTGQEIRSHIVYRKSYAHKDFVNDYHAFKGNAYGLANTLKQTANLKPSIASRKLSNLFYAGQLTVPGPGVPPSLISGQVVAGELIKRINTDRLTSV